MSSIELDKQQRQQLLQKLQDYCQDELDHELGQFDAEFMLDFLLKQFAPYFYNQGLQDAQALIVSRLETIGDAIYEIEQPLP